MDGSTILVIDDRRAARELIRTRLEAAGYRVTLAEDGISGFEAFRRTRPALVVTDVHMPRAGGLAVLREIRVVSRVPVLMLTARGDIPTAVEAVKAGAQDYLTHPDDLERLVPLVDSLIEARPEARGEDLADRIVGESPGMRAVHARVAGLAPLDGVPVLVTGEAGSGRSHVVAALHACSPRGHLPLKRIDCRRGDLRIDPRRDHAVHLDEIGALSRQDQKFLASGLAGHDAHAGLRFYASCTPGAQPPEALHPDLARHFERFEIPLPPLRERISDIPLLVPALCAKLGAALGRRGARVGASGIARLQQYGWPGNVAELARLLEQLIAFSPDGVITRRHVAEALANTSLGVASARRQREQEQRRELVALLDETGGNLAAVARRLALSRSAVHYRARKFGLIGPDRE